MRLTSRVLVGLVFIAALGRPPIAQAQPGAQPTIHRATLQPDTGVLTITGVGLGPDLQVTVDGMPVPQPPGATETQLEVLAPVTVVTMPGTYRLTVVDQMRRVGDGFVVASPAGRLVATGGAASDGVLTSAASAATTGVTAPAVTGPADDTPTRVATTPSPLTVIEDSGSPFNTAVGFEALLFNSTGGSNAAIGYRALRNNTAGLYNTASGYQALLSNSTGTNNTASGHEALFTNTTGGQNTASGASALASNTTGSSNTAIGVSALNRATTASLNTAVGSQALNHNTTGNSNTASGDSALAANTTGSYNTASGWRALAANTTADFNTAYGPLTLGSNTTGFSNTASGYGALFANTTGTLNTAVGQNALVANTTGHANVAVGRDAGSSATTGSYNVFMGADVAGTAGDTNTLRIGLPYDSGTGVGQNQTFIAGIRGTAVTGGEVVVVDAAGKLGSGPFSPGPNSIGTAEVIDNSLTAADIARDAIGTSELLADSVTAAKVAFNYAASTSEGGPALDVACVGCVDATEVGFSYASLAANTFTGTQTLGSGNLELGRSTATAGNIMKLGFPFLHDFGSDNAFVGTNAGNLTMTGAQNTGSGHEALSANTTGGQNTATGAQALTRNTTGGFNTAGGASSLVFNTAGSSNTASGYSAMVFNTAGSDNTAIGTYALAFNLTGGSNVALGRYAGYNATGSHNVFIGADVQGTTADANTMRIGLPYDSATGKGQNQTFIAGIYDTQLTSNAYQVFVDANGQLGTLTPGTLTGTTTISPLATPQQRQEQQAINDELRATVADLRDRLARVEALLAARAGRK